MSELAQLVIDNGLVADADAGNFAAIETALNAKTVERRIGVVKMTPVLMELGEEANGVITAFEATPVGRIGLGKLENEGIDFAHPLTTAQLAMMVEGGGFSQDVSDRLRAMSLQMISPAEDRGIPAPTASEIETAWFKRQVDARADNASTLATERITFGMDADEQRAVWAQAWEDAI